MKTCSRCGMEKPIEDFQVRLLSPDGRQYWCRTCQNAFMRERYHSPKQVAARAVAKERGRAGK